MNSLQLSESLLESVSDCIDSVLGLFFPREKWSDIERGLDSVYKNLGYRDMESLALQIAGRNITGRELESLASALTIGETYFFRERNSLNIFEYRILPELIKEREWREKRLRIWSAGCATGEEPYTIAMILNKYIPDMEEWDITLTATDINTGFIRKAAEGVYTGWSFRDIPLWIIERYFIKKSGNSLELKEEIRKKVSFTYLNLMDDNYPSILNNTNSMDVIFCRNVLMYFSPEKIRRVVGKLYNSLNDGGYLITGQTELSEIYFSSFRSIHDSGAIVYKKDETVKRTDRVSTTSAVKHRDKHAVSPSMNKVHCNEVSNEPDAVKASTSAGIIRRESRDAGIDEIRGFYDSGDYDKACDELNRLIKSSGRNAEALALLARIYANRGRLAEAAEYGSEAVMAESFNPAYQYLLATIYKEAGRITDSVAALRKAIYLDTDFVVAYYALGVIYMMQNNSRDAEKNFNTALELLNRYNPDDTVPESEGIPAGRLAEIISSIKPVVTNG